MAATRTVFIDTALSNYQTLANQYDTGVFDVVLLNAASSHAEQMRSWMQSHGTDIANVNIVSASDSVNGSFTPRIVFVDAGVADLATVIAGVPANATVVVLDANRDGVQQIRDYLAANGGQVGAIDIVTDLASVDVVSHGAPGEVTLGSTVLNAETLAAYSQQLAEIGSHLSANADLLLYGCDVASGTVGEQFIGALAAATGADVAASTDLTGSAAAGGDWTLEASTGSIETVALNIAGYDALLGSVATVTSATLSADTGSSSSDYITNVASQTITFNGTINGNGSTKVWVSTDGTGAIRTAMDVTTVTVNGQTRYTVTPVSLVEGTNRSIQFWDGPLGNGNNNGNLLFTRTYTYDATLSTPTLSLKTDSGIANDSRTNDATLLFSNPDADATRVIKVDNTIVSNYLPGSLSEGSHTVTVTDTDTAGNTKTSAISFTLDTKAPTPAVSLTTDTGKSGTDAITSNAALTIAALESGASRVIKVDGTVVTAYDASKLADGQHTVSVTDTDAAGNAGTATAAFTLDTKAPTTSVTLVANSGDATDSLTNDARLNFGQLENGATRVIRVDGTVTSAYDASQISNGTHTVTVTDTDAAGNNGTAAITFTVDKTAPAPGTLGFTNLLDSGVIGDGVTRDRDFNLTLSGNEADSTVRYEVSVNGGAFTTTTAAQTGLVDGSYQFRAVVTDLADNRSITEIASVTIDGTAPGAPSITGFSDNSGSAADTLTKDTTPTLTISAEADSVVEVFRNGVSVGTATQTSTKGVYTFTSTVLADGSHDFTAKATDAAGNVSSVSATQNVTVDATAPAPTLVLANDSGAAGDRITNDASLTFGAVEAGATRVIKVDGATVTAYNASGLGDGSHTVEITDTDAADNSATAAVTFTVDKTAPASGTLGFTNLLDSGATGDDLTNDRDFNLTLSGNEDGSSVRYEVSVNGGAFTATTAAQTGLADGSYQFRAIVTDIADNQSITQVASLTVDATAPGAPSITGFSDNSGSAADTLTKDTTPTLTISAEADSVVEVFRNGVSVGTATQSATKGVYTFTSTGLADGSHDFTAKATDAAGNVSNVSAAQNVTVDATAPAPTLILANDSGAAGDRITNDASLTFSAIEAGATRVIKVDGETVTAYNAAGLGDGSHTVEIIDTDAADNSGSASVVFTVDKTAPASGTLGFTNLLDSGTSGDGLTNDRDFNLALSGNEDGSSVRYEVSVNGGAFTTTTAAQAGLADGSYQFRAVVTDIADNSSISQLASVIIDATAPGAPAITAFSDNSGSAADTLTKDTTPTLTISAEADSVVEVFRNGVSVGNATQTGTKGVYTFTSAVLADGSHDFTAKATDAAGNVSSLSALQNVTVDATAPTPTLVLANDSGAAGDRITNDASLTFGAIEAGATRVIKVDGQTVTAYNAAGLGDGSHTVEITDTDTADNSGTAAVTFTVDKTAPASGTLGFTNLLDSGVTGDSLTNDRDFNLALSGNEDGSTVRYEVSVNGGAFTATTAAQAGLADGSYQFRAIVTDIADNSSITELASVTIDATAPNAPSITAFSDNSGSAADTLTKDTTPTLTISAEADSVVEVFRNGVSVGNATQTGTKGVYTFTSAVLADGSHDFTVKATDAAGNVSSVSATQNVTVDATAPAPTLVLANDSGADGDRITKDASLTFGAIEAGTTRVIKVDGETVTSYNAAGLGDGSHTVEITDTDAADNSASASVVFTVDKTAPASGTLGFANLLDSGTSGDGLTNDRDFNLALSGNEDGSSVRYEVSVNGGAFTATTAAQAGLADGSYQFRAIVTDIADNSSITELASVTIDATAPNAPSITAFSDNSGSAADTLTKDTTPTLTISAEADSVVEVFRNGVSVGNATQTGTKGVYTFTSAVLADGSHDFTVKATDAAGNASSVSATQNVTVDATAPAPTLVLANDSGAAGDRITNDASLTFGAIEAGATRVIKVDGETVTAYNAAALGDGTHTIEITDTDTADNSGTAAVTFTVDKTAPASGTLGFTNLLDSGATGDSLTNDRDFSLALSGNEDGSTARYEVSVNGGAFTATTAAQAGLADGSYQFRAIVTDIADNSSITQLASVTIDATAPGAPAITAFSDNTGSTADTLTKDTTPTLTISAEADSVVEVFRNGVSVGTATQSATKGVYTFTSTVLADGSHDFTVKATDAAGNVSSVSATQNVTVDATAPTPTLVLANDSGVAADRITNDASLTFSAIEAGATRVIKVDGETVTAYNAAGLGDGTHTVEITDTDTADNSGSAAVTFTVDKTAPASGTLGFTNLVDSGTSGDSLTNDRDFNLALTGNEAGSSVRYEVSVNGGAFTATTAAQTGLADGSYQFRAIVTDIADNSSITQLASVTIDATAPGAPAITAFSDNSGSAADTLTKDTTPTLTISAEADSVVEVFRNGVSVGVATQTSTKGVYSFTSTVLADGSHDFTVKATDVAGNRSSASAVQNVTVDATAPAPTLSLVADSGKAGDALTNDARLSISALESGATRVIKVDGETVAAYDASKLADGGHTVEITDTDAADNTASRSFSFTLDGRGPAFTSGGSASVAENIGENQVVYRAAANDANGVAYSLAGADAAKFSIAADGSVMLKENPNFESVSAYAFTVVATDNAGNHTDQAVALGITNVNEAPVANSVSKSTIENNQLAFQLADYVSDVDAGDRLSLSLPSTTITLTWANTDAKAASVLINPVTKAAVDLSTLSVKASLAADGTITLTPPAELDWLATGQAVKATINYAVTDAAGMKSQDAIEFVMNGSTNDKGVNLSGGNGDDTLAGNLINNAEDVLNGNNGNDTLSGYGGTDVLYGGNGDDKLYGGTGIDYLYGDSGNDTIEGGLDGDFIFGGKGNDILKGDGGADKFVFAPQSGNDRIVDFTISEGDKLFFADFFTSTMTVESFVAKYVTDIGNDLQINLQGTTIILTGVANVSALLAPGIINFGVPF